MHLIYTPSTKPVAAIPSSKRPYHWVWLTIEGRDALDFLHRLTTVNVKNLIPGEGAPGCFLTGQGKMRGYFQLWNTAPGQYGLELDAGIEAKTKQELLAFMDQFTFAEKYSVSDSALEPLWIFPEDEAAFLRAVGATELKAGLTQMIGDLRLCHQGQQAFGRPWITAWGPQTAEWRSQNLASARELTAAELEAWRVSALSPRVGVEIDENSIPLELGLTRAISDNKGCYPGQEVIERIVSLGAPAKRLCLIEGTGAAPAPGTALKSPEDSEIGVITSVTTTASGYHALGLVRKTHAKEALELQTTAPPSRGKIVRIAPFSTHN